ALRRLDHDSRTLTDPTQIRDLGDKVRAIAKTYAGDPEVEAAAGRMLDVLAQMQDASALLSRRDFAGLQKTCERLCAQYPQHVLFQRLESEAARGLRQAAVQELRHKLQTEQDLEARSKLLDEALPLYPEEAWLQQEARAVRGKLALVNTIVEKARAAATAERWDEAIEQWNSLRGLYANYPGLDRELESLTARKQEARAALRARYVQQIREQMASCDYSPAAGLAQRASRDFAGDAELQTLREQIDVAQRAVEDARAAAAKQAFAPAARILETALGRYAGDPLLEREREAIERQAAAREAGITEAMRQSGELADEQDLDDALQ